MQRTKKALKVSSRKEIEEIGDNPLLKEAYEKYLKEN